MDPVIDPIQFLNTFSASEADTIITRREEASWRGLVKLQVQRLRLRLR